MQMICVSALQVTGIALFAKTAIDQDVKVIALCELVLWVGLPPS